MNSKKEEIGFDISLLLKEDIIPASGDKFKLSEVSLLYYSLIKEFYKQFDYKLNGDVSELFILLDKIYRYLIPKPHNGKSRFTAGIDKAAPWQHHQLFLSSFGSFLSMAKKKPGDSFYTIAKYILNLTNNHFA